MKILPKLAALLALALTPPLSAAPGEVQQLLTEAQTAYLRGDLETAKANFQMVNQIDPRNQVAIAYLRKMKVEEAARAKTGGQEKALASVLIPKVEFRDATMRESLEVLRKKVAEISAGKQTVNFVLPPGEPADSARVTLSLSNLPFTEVVRYVGKVTNFDFTYEKFAIVGKPVKPGAAVQ